MSTITPEEAFTVRLLRKQGLSRDDLKAEFSFSDEELDMILKGQLHPEAGGPLEVIGKLNPDGYEEGARKEFCKRALSVMRDRLPAERFSRICSENGVDVNDTLNF